ncbi:MAG: Crp/Fnr family transcriptional regulator [Actinomycetota bacterium]
MRYEHSPLIQALTPRERERLLDRAVPRVLARGETLYLSGDDDRRVHLVTEGLLLLAARDGAGDETLLGLAVPGELVGDASAIDGDPQPFDVIAATRSAVVGIDADLLVDILAGNGGAALELARTVAMRTRWLSAIALERAHNDVSARIAGRLLDLAELLGRMRSGTIEMELPLSQTEMGRLAGVCRESASKTLNRMRSKGILDYSGKTLRIYRPDMLERIRCAGRAAEPFRSTDAAAPRRSRSS